MPNGGPRPDCVHCKHYRGRPVDDEGDPSCALYTIELASPIYAFCARFADREPNGDSDWLDEELDRKQLRTDMMYLSLGGDEIKFIHVPLVSIAEYANWTRETFVEALDTLFDKHRNDLHSKDA